MKTLLKTAFLMLLAIRLCGQTPIEDQVYDWLNYGDTSMTVIRETVYNYLDTTQSTTAEKLAKKFGRWYNYWNSRIDSNDRMDKSWLYMNTYFQNNAPSNPPNPNAGPNPLVCNDGGDWSLVGPLSFGSQNLGLVGCLYTPSPHSNVIYAGSNTGGLWKTSNANDPTPIWTCVTDDPKRPAMGVQDIAVDPNDTNTLYIATGITTHSFSAYGSGVLKSTDAGNTWNDTGLSWSLVWGEFITVLKTHPTQSGVIFAGGLHKVRKSTDGGVTWNIVLNVPGIGLIRDIEFLPMNSNVMLMVTNVNIFSSTNGGSTWTDMTSTLNYTHPQCTSFVATAFEIATTPANSDAFYIHFGNGGVPCRNCPSCPAEPTYEPVYKITYTSGGFQNWVQVSSHLNTDVGVYMNEFEISPVDSNIYYIGDIYFYRKDLGSPQTLGNAQYGWNSILHADIRDVQIFHKNGKDIIFAATDGGVSKSINNASSGSWVDMNGYGPQITQFHDIGLTSEKKGYIIGGAQDNHSFVYNGTTWTNILDGDGMQSLVSWDNPNRVYASGNCRLARSNNATTFAWTNYDIVLSNPFADYILRQDPEDPQVLYAAKEKTFEILRDVGTGNISTIETIAQNRTVPFTSNIPIYNPAPFAWWFQTIEVAPSNPNIIYASIGWQFAAFSTTEGTTQKLWRSDDGGDTWFAMGSFYWNIDAIAIDPNNPDRIWLGMQGYGSTSNPLNGRIFYSDNASSTNATFSDVSTGLPMFPIQALIYQKHSNDILYCGNDIAVYRFDPDNQEWVCFSQNLPPIIIADLEINYCERKLYTSAYGRGIWSTPLYEDDAWIMTGNHTIPTGRKEHHANDIIIPSGVTLTVAGTLNMGKGTKIIVEQGGKISLTGSITNLCGEVWEGIQIWGTGNGSAQDPVAQGFLEINNGTIEYAKEAVQLWSPGRINTTGGIVKATNATFRNNWRSVEFMKYQNGVLGQGGVFIPKPNVSFFKDCTFDIDDDYREFSAGKPFLGHISMWWVDGVKIIGCAFKNSVVTHPLFTKAEDYGYGIQTIDASFSVTANTFPLTPLRSSFYRLFEGIKVSRIATNRAPAIDLVDFVNNHYGVFNAGVNNMLLTRSGFILGKFPEVRMGVTNIHEGFVNHGGVGFIVEENDFSFDGSNATSAILVGARIADTDVTDNRLYRNTYSSLFANNLANGINGGLGGTQFPQPGLKYLCNGQSAGSFDMIVGVNPGDTYASVAELQFLIDQATGDEISAANTFSDNPFMNIWNTGLGVNPLMQYRYWPQNQAEIPGSVQNVNAISADLENDCPTNFTGPTTTNPYESEELMAWVNIYYDQTQNEANAKVDWADLLDAGDSNNWLDKVNNAYEGNVEEVKGELLELAPWASEAVLKAMVNNEAFSSAQLLDVLEVHPDVLRKATFFSFLQNEQNALDYNQVESLESFAADVTARTDLEAAITSYSNDKVYAANMVIRHYLNDTLPHLDSLKAWYQNIGDIASDYAITDLYWQYDRIDDGMYWLNEMPSRYEFTAAQETIYDDYKALKTLLQNVLEDNRSFLDLESTELAEVTALAEKGVALPYIQAQNLLNFGYNGTYRKEAYLPEILEERRMQVPEEEEVVVENQNWIIKAVPNPTNAQTVLSYLVGDIAGDARLYISNLNGQEIFSAKLQKPSGEVVLNTTAWSAGTYLCIIRVGKEKSKVYKLTVAK